MSATPTLVTEQHVRYVAERTRGDDEFLRRLKQAAREAGFPPIWISPEQASLMAVLLRATRASTVIEVGTLAGSTAIAMARALPPHGRLLTIELDPQRAAFARDWVARSDVADRVEVRTGRAVEVLAGLPARSADVLFLDADKAGYPAYLEEGYRLLKPGGLLLADNAFAFGQLFDSQPTDREVGAVRAFNDLVAEHVRRGRLDAVIVPVGDGLWVGSMR